MNDDWVAMAKIVQQVLHDYRFVIGGFFIGWHMKQPRYMRPSSKEPVSKEEG